MEKDIAISVKNVSKTFKIPHEKVSSLRGAAVSAFSRNKGYEEFKALDDVSFEVKKGEFFGIIGRNGSGKSTLLKILAGIYQADTPVKSGEAGAKQFHGVKVNGMISPFLELGIGFNPELSGRDNVYLNATVLGMTKKEIDKKFDSIVQFSELERFIDQKLKNYSSGMQVRLAFSVSIHANREILLMDEVLAVGDSNFQKKCIQEFEKYRNFGKTVILVTHDIGTVKEYCDRAVLINDGKVVSVGDPGGVVDDYMEINMTDEERRLKKENYERVKKIDGTNEKENDVHDTISNRFGNKNAVIRSYSVCNHEGKEVSVLESKGGFSVKLNVVFNEFIKKASIGVMFRKNPKDNLVGFHSLCVDKPVYCENIEAGSNYNVKISGSMPLAPGIYYVSFNVSSHETENDYEIMDALENVKQISIFGSGKYWGLIDTHNAEFEIELV